MTVIQNHDEARARVQLELEETLKRQRAAFSASTPSTLELRCAKLAKLAAVIRENQSTLVQAVSSDFGHRSHHETQILELVPTLTSIRYIQKRLPSWMRPERRQTGWMFKPARLKIIYQPLGCVGVMSPWNYPLQLPLIALATAWAAGNNVMIRPSEIMPETSAALKTMLHTAFDRTDVAVVLGDLDVSKAFSGLPFDHLMFTGSTSVGKQIMQAAAQNLTPVTLELGGKSPTIIADDYDLSKAADSIMGGKLMNAGQTCVAPDYVLVPRRKLEGFVVRARQSVAKFYPTLNANPDYTSIVNERHFTRLSKMLAETREANVRTLELNPANEALDSGSRKITPTLVIDPKRDSRLMKEEIFGPILPVIPFDSLSEAVAFINARPRPLALYVFSNKRSVVDKIMRDTTAGGMCVNETVMHVGQDDIPFGGVGPSGMGAYHGIEGFKTFSHAKSIFTQSSLNGVRFIRPPYGRLINAGLSFLIGKK